jgi:hypothetical protein
MLRVVALLIFGTTLLSAFCTAQGAEPQRALEARLSSDRLGQVDAGTYLAGDRVAFALDSTGANYLLSFAGAPEIFVLHSDSASLGGRVLKYDTGETALSVSGWGALTLFTDSAPSGLPAVRTGDFSTPVQPAVSLQEVQDAAADDAGQLTALQRLSLAFSADWAALSASAQARAIALDAIENVTRGIERFCQSPRGRNVISRRIAAVDLTVAGRPTVTLDGRTLIVTFNPDLGYEGRASSRSIAFALGSLLSAPKNQS